MSREFRETLFEPFSREKTSTVSRIQGTGLGMSIDKNILDLMGGTITVESEPGKGSRFDITCDFQVANESDVASDTVFTEKEISFSGRRVLLVEDNEMNREIARDILEERGISVDEAEDGDQAVAVIQDILSRGEPDYYDFILMDIQMPHMNGYEATKQIRALPWPKGFRIPIIAMTANAFEEDRKNALKAGMDAHMVKPIDTRSLFETLTKFLYRESE